MKLPLDDYSIMVPREVDNAEWRWVFTCSTLLLVVITVPFVLAYSLGEPDATFVGILVNPMDGASYLAKMQQGLHGNWLFRLPYTPEPHQGVFVYPFYLALGHLARVFNLPAILIFHAARLIGSMLMFLSIYRFVADWTSSVEQRRLSWLLATVGAGFGWLAFPLGTLTPDMLTVPEAFPLQAAYANAHFPWAIGAALLLAHTLIVKCLADDSPYPGLDIETIGLAAASVLLINVSPFMLAPIGLGFGAFLIWLAWRRREFPRREFDWGAVVLIFCLPFVAYNAWAFSSQNPVFNSWMSQNLTPSPPAWQYLVAFGPVLVLAAIGLTTLRRAIQPGDVFLLGWLLTNILLLYAPLGLQRRFSMGLIVPMAVYAGRGLWRVLLPRLPKPRRALALVLTFAMFMPTTVLALVIPVRMATQWLREDGGQYYISHSEEQVFEWLAEHAPGAVVLASPETGLHLPVYDVRVVYGHSMETINAAERGAAVLAFFSGEDCSVLSDESVDYVLVGPRERELAGSESCAIAGPAVYQTPGDGDVIIYATRATTTH